MRGAEFLRRLRRLGRARGIDVVFVADKGKGSHGTVYFGARRTTVKTRGDIGPGLLHRMLKDLGLGERDL